MRRDDQTGQRPAIALADFEGVWQLSREIIQDTGPPAHFHGQAVWTPEGSGLSYDETGVLVVEGQGRFTAERRYHWGSDLRVYFEDGRFFHQVPAQGGRTGHWCDPDQYDVAYDFDAWPAFTTQWVVKGPRKAYQMISQYRR